MPVPNNNISMYMNPEEKVNFPTMRVRCFNIAQLGCVKFVSNFPIQLVKLSQ